MIGSCRWSRPAAAGRRPEQLGGLVGAGEDQPVTRGSDTSRRPRSCSVSWTSRSTSRGTPASHNASTITDPVRRACDAGFTTTADPAASADSVEPAGIASQEVPRRGDHGEPDRLVHRTVHVVQRLGQRRVVVREVDRLGHLGIALVDVLPASAAITSSSSARRRSSTTAALRRWAARSGRSARPLRTCLDRAGDHGLDLLGRAQGRALDQVVADGTGRNPGQDLPAPGRVRGAVRGRCPRRCGRSRPPCPGGATRRSWVRFGAGTDRSSASRAGTGPSPREQRLVVVQVEHRGHEVLPAGALLEPADQVGDRHVELGGVHQGV